MSELPFQKHKLHAYNRGAVAKNSLHQASSGVGKVRVHGPLMRVQIAQQRIVATAPSEAQAGERDSVPEPARNKVRFGERVENKHQRYCDHDSTEHQQQFQQQSGHNCHIDACR